MIELSEYEKHKIALIAYVLGSKREPEYGLSNTSMLEAVRLNLALNAESYFSRSLGVIAYHIGGKFIDRAAWILEELARLEACANVPGHKRPAVFGPDHTAASGEVAVA